MPKSMAEHALAMALAAAKRLIVEHENLKLGQFNQFTRNRMLAGGLRGIFGFGGIGAATARLMHSIGMRVHAINRHGRTDEQVDWIGTPERLNELLAAADVLLISAPLTRAISDVMDALRISDTFIKKNPFYLVSSRWSDSDGPKDELIPVRRLARLGTTYAFSPVRAPGCLAIRDKKVAVWCNFNRSIARLFSANEIAAAMACYWFTTDRQCD